jgi:hypothetical protein
MQEFYNTFDVNYIQEKYSQIDCFNFTRIDRFLGQFSKFDQIF